MVLLVLTNWRFKFGALERGRYDWRKETNHCGCPHSISALGVFVDRAISSRKSVFQFSLRDGVCARGEDVCLVVAFFPRSPRLCASLAFSAQLRRATSLNLPGNQPVSMGMALIPETNLPVLRPAWGNGNGLGWELSGEFLAQNPQGAPNGRATMRLQCKWRAQGLQQH